MSRRARIPQAFELATWPSDFRIAQVWLLIHASETHARSHTPPLPMWKVERGQWSLPGDGVLVYTSLFAG